MLKGKIKFLFNLLGDLTVISCSLRLKHYKYSNEYGLYYTTMFLYIGIKVHIIILSSYLYNNVCKPKNILKIFLLVVSCRYRIKYINLIFSFKKIIIFYTIM